jgi:hypothetical protein
MTPSRSNCTLLAFVAFASIAMELRVPEITIVSPLVRSPTVASVNALMSTSLVMQGSVGAQTGSDVGEVGEGGVLGVGTGAGTAPGTGAGMGAGAGT